jgi:hypothetical protein
MPRAGCQDQSSLKGLVHRRSLHGLHVGVTKPPTFWLSPINLYKWRFIWKSPVK